MSTSPIKSEAKPRILRLPEVCHICGLSQSTIRRKEAEGSFPARLRLGGNAVGWLEAEVFEWLETRERGFVSCNTSGGSND